MHEKGFSFCPVSCSATGAPEPPRTKTSTRPWKPSSGTLRNPPRVAKGNEKLMKPLVGVSNMNLGSGFLPLKAMMKIDKIIARIEVPLHAGQRK